MKYKRIIARLDVKNNALVKGIHMEGLRVLGSPEHFAKQYYDDGIDEIIYMDVVASLYQRNGLVELVKKTARNIFIPLTVGGGIRTLEDVRELLSSGADKVCINTAAVKNPNLISEIADMYGASTLVVAIEVIKAEGRYLVFVDNGREYTGLEVVEWAKTIEELGAGEILLTSVDQEGTCNGLDFELIERVKVAVSLPVIVHGGIGSKQDIYRALKEHDIDAVCVASVFHYDTVNKIDNVGEGIMGNTSFLKSNATKKNIEKTSVRELKNEIKNEGVEIR